MENPFTTDIQYLFYLFFYIRKIVVPYTYDIINPAGESVNPG